MPVGGIRTWLAELPGGQFADDLNWDQVASWIQKEKLNEKEKTRMDEARKRHEYYSGAGDERMMALIKKVFNDRDVIEKRQQWVAQGKYVNVEQRLVNEGATTYAIPAKRRIGEHPEPKEGEEVELTQDQKNYEELQVLSREDEMALRWDRWLELHNNLILGMRIRTNTAEELEPVIDVVTPGHFWALGSPVDPTKLLALGMDIGRPSPIPQDKRPKWVVWTDVEVFYLTESGSIIKELTNDDHGWERMPYMLLAVEPPHGELLDPTRGADMVAAHESVWFQNVLLGKESKSATKLLAVAGDTTSAARKQSADTEGTVEVAEGTLMAAIDMGMDLSQFRDNSRTIYESNAAGRGIAPAILHHAGVQSAEARESLQAPTKQQRRTRQVYLRTVEWGFVRLQAMVVRRNMPRLRFDPKKFKVDFADFSTPLDPKKRTEVFEHKRRLFLTNTVQQLMLENPDLNEKEAWEQMIANIAIETARQVATIPLQKLAGGQNNPTAPTQGGTTEDQRGLVPATPAETGEKVTPTNGRGRRRRDV